MSARRRRRRRDGDTPQNGDGGQAKSGGPSNGDGQSKSGGQAKSGGQSKGGGGQGSDGNRNRGGRSGGGAKNRSKKNRRSRGRGGSRRRDSVGLWGDARKLPEPRSDVRITDDPAAVPRSLGPPPLPGHDEVAVHYFTAVYDRAVMMAGALAAAGGLLEPEQLEEELGDGD